MSNPTDNSACARLGHDDKVTYEDDESMVWVCRRCGAEGWEDLDTVPARPVVEGDNQ